MKDKTVEQIIEGIPEDMRGHVFHALGKALGHHTAQPSVAPGGGGDGGDDGDSGDNYPKPGGK